MHVSLDVPTTLASNDIGLGFQRPRLGEGGAEGLEEGGPLAALRVLQRAAQELLVAPARPCAPHQRLYWRAACTHHSGWALVSMVSTRQGLPAQAAAGRSPGPTDNAGTSLPGSGRAGAAAPLLAPPGGSRPAGRRCPSAGSGSAPPAVRPPAMPAVMCGALWQQHRQRQWSRMKGKNGNWALLQGSENCSLYDWLIMVRAKRIITASAAASVTSHPILCGTTLLHSQAQHLSSTMLPHSPHQHGNTNMPPTWEMLGLSATW